MIAASDWVIDVGPGAGEDGGRIVAQGPPEQVANARGSRTAPYLLAALEPQQLTGASGWRQRHSDRSAWMTSTRDARAAGMSDAATAAACSS